MPSMRPRRAFAAHGIWYGRPTDFTRTYASPCRAAAQSGRVFDLTPVQR